MPVLVLSFVFALMVGVLLGAGLGVSGVQMKRGMGIAAGERERQQQHNQAAQKGRPLHGTITDLRKVGQGPESRIAQDCPLVKPAKISVTAGFCSGIGGQ